MAKCGECGTEMGLDHEAGSLDQGSTCSKCVEKYDSYVGVSRAELSLLFANQREQTEISLLEREHRLFSAVSAFFSTENRSGLRRQAALKGLSRCLIQRLFFTATVASVGGIGILGLFIAWQANNLLWEQNSRIGVQSHLIEAERRAALVFELAQVMDVLDRESARRADITHSQTLQIWHNALTQFKTRQETQDPLIQENLNNQFTPSGSIIGRISALSQSLRPYYFVDYSEGVSSFDQATTSENAEGILERLKRATLPDEVGQVPRLVDRPVSPERGQLLRYLVANDVNLHAVSNSGATFAGADLSGGQLYYAVFPAIDLSQADFSGALFSTVRFGLRPEVGTVLEGADFSCAVFLNTWFSAAVMRHARFAHVDFSSFTLVDEAKFEASEQLSGNVIFADDLLEIDATDANFHDWEVDRQLAPWAIDPSIDGPVGYRPEDWRVEVTNEDKIRFFRVGSVQYDRANFCG